MSAAPVAAKAKRATRYVNVEAEKKYAMVKKKKKVCQTNVNRTTSFPAIREEAMFAAEPAALFPPLIFALLPLFLADFKSAAAALVVAGDGEFELLLVLVVPTVTAISVVIFN
jgi:hypothetical protein